MTFDEAVAELGIRGLLVSRPRNGRLLARCPAHDDRSASLSLRDRNGVLLAHCFAGCGFKEILAGLGGAKESRAEPGDLLERLAAAKRLDVAGLERLGWRNDRGWLRIPYLEGGSEVAARYRTSLETAAGPWSWGSAGKPARLPAYDACLGVPERWVVLVEGETDAATGWQLGCRTIGFPGAELVSRVELPKRARVAYVREQDAGGNTFECNVLRCFVSYSPKRIDLDGAKDLNAAWCVYGQDRLRELVRKAWLG